MHRRTGFASAAPILMLAIVTAVASASDRWVHIRVVESGEDGETVSINLPLPLAESVLQSIQCNSIKDGKVQVKLHSGEIDLAAVHAALQQAQDGEYITVDSNDEQVRIAKEGGTLHIRADDDGEKVNIQLDLAVLDALFPSGTSGTGELDVRSALHALGTLEKDMELVQVESEDETVHIWIDGSAGQK
jgi:hypothetical protein